jgi:effector-binding domain-containing protein
MRAPRILGTLLVLAPLACQSPRASESPGDLPSLPDVALSRAPFSDVHCAYKERMEQRYVFLELLGSYALTGRSLPEVARLMRQQGVEPAGSVPVERLRSRIGFPVDSVGTPKEPLRADVLPSATVAYALAGGAYPEVPRCYPGLLAYVKKMHWVVAGPIREIYLVEPVAVADWSELRCEVQIPVTMAP